ncbi:MAG: metal ABC transporter substrate-binding protein [Anaerolineales bacterium]
MSTIRGHFARSGLLLLIALIGLLLAACSAAGPASGLQVVASTEILGDVAAEIAGEHIQITVLIPPATDPHAFEPSAQDAARLETADLILVNGLDLEEPLLPLLRAAGDRVVSASDGIETLQGRENEGGVDPHVWMNPLNVKIWAGNIAQALSSLDPDHASSYRANADAYISELDALDAWAIEQIGQIPIEQRVLVTDHETFGYFADHYGFEIVGALIPSYSTISEPSAGELAALEEAIRRYEVKAIFVGANMNTTLAERVAADTGILLIPLYTESFSAAVGPAATYLDLIRYDVNAIVAALK